MQKKNTPRGLAAPETPTRPYEGEAWERALEDWGGEAPFESPWATGLDADGKYPKEPVPPSRVSDAAASYSVPDHRLQVAVDLVVDALDDELDLLRDMVRFGSESSRKSAARGLRKALEMARAQEEADAPDPFAGLDDPLDAGAATEAVAWADLESRRLRAGVLEDAVSAEKAGRMTGRTRQAIERQRREGRLLALRAGRQWRYPVWQFDLDGPGGLLPGLKTVLSQLFMSPPAAALWLTSPHDSLGGESPSVALRRRRTAEVEALAEQAGHLP